LSSWRRETMVMYVSDPAVLTRYWNCGYSDHV
jgi:hypothetical protein